MLVRYRIGHPAWKCTLLGKLPKLAAIIRCLWRCGHVDAFLRMLPAPRHPPMQDHDDETEQWILAQTMDQVEWLWVQPASVAAIAPGSGSAHRPIDM